jgi:hypothetical protein
MPRGRAERPKVIADRIFDPQFRRAALEERFPAQECRRSVCRAAGDEAEVARRHLGEECLVRALR